MSASRSPLVRLVCLLCLTALLVTVAVSLTACGSDFEGTWVKEGEEGEMVIAKSDDGFDVTIKTGGEGSVSMTLTAEEDGDKLILKDPTGASQDVVEMTVDGDKLTMKSGDETETLKRK